MSKGVKKIGYRNGKIDTKRSSASKVIVYGGEEVSFEVKEWEKETTEADKKNGVTWLRQSENRKVLSKVHAPLGLFYYLTLPKNLCGIYRYYIEASLSGKTDKRPLGVHIVGYCETKITKAQWSLSPNGFAVKSAIDKGSTVYLDIATEGLNGYNHLSVDIYNKDGDKFVTTIQSTKVVDGFAVVELKTTTLQIFQMLESFYVKIKNPVSGNYLYDNNKNEKLANYLQVSNAFVLPSFLAPTNIVPAKVGQINANYTKNAACRYDKITITDKDSYKDHFDIEIYDSVKHPIILPYETIAGASESSKKEIKLTYKKYANKQCFTKPNHKKEVEIFIDGVKQKTEVINGETVTVDLVAKVNTMLLRASPEIFFITPDPTTHYQIITKTCAQPAGILNVNVFPNVERELAFIVSLFGIKGLNKETNVKDVKKGDGSVNRIGGRDTLTGYNGEKGMKLVSGQLEILEQKKGALGWAFQAKVKVDNITSSVELGKTKNQIKELVSFYNKIIEITKEFDGRGKESTSLAFKQGKFPKATFDIDPPNVAFALRMTNALISGQSKVVTEYSGGIALKPITKIKIGVDLISLIPYFGWQGRIASWILEKFTEQAKIEIYIIFEISFEARAEFNLAYNEIEGIKAGKQKLELEIAATAKIGLKSRDKVTLTIITSDGTTDKSQVEKFKAEGSIISGLLYTYEINGEGKKGMSSQHKLEFTGLKASIIVYSIGDRMKYNVYAKKEFTIIPKPQEPWYKSNKEYF